MSSQPEPLDLCDAILGNSPCLVDYWLHVEGRSPNHRPKLTLFDEIADGGGRVEDSERILGETSDYACAPLHVAILNAHHNGRNDGIAQRQRAGALSILDSLLEAGADATATCDKVLFCNVGGIAISSPGAPLDPIALALSLKKVRSPSDVHAEERVDMMDQVLERIVKYKIQQQRNPTASAKAATTTTIPKLVAQTYRDLCLSDLYSDVTIVCLDGTEFPAHANVLASSSSVLKNAIKNAANDGTRRLVISRSPAIVKAMLTFLYTGTLNKDNNKCNHDDAGEGEGDSILERETAALLAVAADYQLQALEQVCAAKCGERLTVHNVRLMMDIGDRHDAKWIMKECLDFLQKQPLPVVLGHPKLLALATERPRVWEQLLMAVGGQYAKGIKEAEDEQARAAVDQGKGSS